MDNHTTYDGKAVSAELLAEFERAFGFAEGVREAVAFVRGEGESPKYFTGFEWSETSQGLRYWYDIFYEGREPSLEDIEYLEQMLAYAEKRDGAPVAASVTKWTDWQMITSGEPDIPEGVRSEITKRDGALPVSADNPTMYRYEVKPAKAQPFAVVFDKKGFACSIWAPSHGGTWRDQANVQGGWPDHTVRFYEGDTPDASDTPDATKLREERDALLALVKVCTFWDDGIDKIPPEQAAIVRALLERPQ